MEFSKGERVVNIGSGQSGVILATFEAEDKFLIKLDTTGETTYWHEDNCAEEDD